MQLILSPNKWLDTVVDQFDFDNLDALQIEKQMIDVMLKNDGIGLSANQVGINAKIFTIRPINLKEPPFAIINPRIISLSEETEDAFEGCLSHPNLALKVSRPQEVVTEFVDSANKTVKLTLRGIDARCFLHEFDHLHGIEFTDRVSALKLKMAKKKQLKIDKRIQNG